MDPGVTAVCPEDAPAVSASSAAAASLSQSLPGAGDRRSNGRAIKRPASVATQQEEETAMGDDRKRGRLEHNSDGAGAEAAGAATGPTCMIYHAAACGGEPTSALHHGAASASLALPPASMMLSLLGRDSGARQSLLYTLSLAEMAALRRSCRSWVRWLDQAGSLTNAHQQISVSVSSASFASYQRCRWLHRFVHAVLFRGRAGSSVEFDRVLAAMPQWSRLQSIQVTTELTERVLKAQHIRDGFSAVASTLQHLTVHFDTLFPPVPALLASVAVLPQLRSLDVSWQYTMMDTLDFAPLSSLPHLSRLRIPQPGCSPLQIQALSQCRSLTDLHCGAWLPDRTVTRPNDPNLDQWIEAHLGMMLRLRQQHGSAPLRRLHFGPKPMILPQCWRWISQCVATESLCGLWSAKLTSADWLQLRHFDRLVHVEIRELDFERDESNPSCRRSPLDLGIAFSGLRKCRALRALHMDGLFDLRTEHAEHLAHFPALQTLSFQFMHVQSLAPLTAAPCLTDLTLIRCSGLQAEAINVRAMLPALHLVTHLQIDDDHNSLLTVAEAEPFNRALLLRMPRLTAQEFTQGNVHRRSS